MTSGGIVKNDNTVSVENHKIQWMFEHDYSEKSYYVVVTVFWSTLTGGFKTPQPFSGFES
jgi:hypothetical protein